jgi:hypothetical protein
MTFAFCNPPSADASPQFEPEANSVVSASTDGFPCQIGHFAWHIREEDVPILFVQDHGQQRLVDFDPSVVFDKTQFPEFVHEKIHA